MTTRLGAQGHLELASILTSLVNDLGTDVSEITLILEGQATFTVGESTREVATGNIVIGPAGVPHKFTPSGEGILRIVTIHPSPKTIGTRVEG